MTCIKTGADVWVDGHGSVHGDLHEVGGVYILNCGGPWRECVLGSRWEARPKVNTSFHAWYEVGTRVLACMKEDSDAFHYQQQ